MDISYRRKHNDSYMIITSERIPASYETKMLERNKIKSLLDLNKMEVNCKQEYWYTISKKESIKDYLEGEDLSRELLEKIIMQTYLALEETGKYLINSNHILINPETLFIEKLPESIRISLCYYPGIDETVQVQFRSILEYFICTLQTEDKAFSEMVYKLYDISLKEEYNLMELLEYMHGQAEAEPVYVKKVELPEDTVESEYASDPSNEIFKEYYEKPRKESFFKRLRRKRKEKNMDRQQRVMEDFVIEPGIEINEPTVLLSNEGRKSVGKLVYDGEKGEDNFVVDRDVFRIGSANGKNNGVLHSKAVSHHHAKITRKGEDYYLEDCNSLNGTYLNGHVLSYKEERLLKPMDQIIFADASYVFM